MNKNIVVFYGTKGVGKDTSCRFFNKLYLGKYKQVSFANAVKKTVWYLFGDKIGKRSRVYGAIDAKEEPIVGWEIPKGYGFPEMYWSGRRLLQWFGTDVCRKMYPSIWVDIALKMIRKRSLVVVTDCRFKNEEEALAALKKEGYTVYFVRINRKSDSNEFSGHASEVDMVHFRVDYVIENDGSLGDLAEKVEVFVKWMESRKK
jgi:hypothetical protein